MPWRVLFFWRGCGADCSSYTELVLSERMGLTGEDIMFTSNLVEMRHCGSQGGCAWDSFQNLHNWAGWYIVLPPCQGNNTPLKEYQRLGWWNCFSNEKQIGHGWEANQGAFQIQVPFPQKHHCTPRNHVSCPVFIPFILVTSTEEGQRAGSPGKPGRHLPHRLPGCWWFARAGELPLQPRAQSDGKCHLDGGVGYGWFQMGIGQTWRQVRPAILGDFGFNL